MKPRSREYFCLAVALVGTVFAGLAFAGSSTVTLAGKTRAVNVTITRDDWGIAHVVGKTDADAVFGMIYAQAEDDFNRIETNYLNSLGRLAEAEGESAIWSDLRMKMFIDPAELKKNYASSPPWLKQLMTAWADGLNYYLATHTDVKPRVITKFEPWMALSFREGSIGGDIETIDLGPLRAMYDSSAPAQALLQTEDEIFPPEPKGSNGIAIAPKNTTGGNALLLINPHTSFYFRSELQMTSAQGLNAYGAVTWGQFFIYQGFNDRLGWMHTSSAVDAIDEYREKPVEKDGGYFYTVQPARLVPFRTRTISVPFKTAGGQLASRTFKVFYSEHGPIIRKDASGDWISISLMHEPVKALMQSYGRTKAKNLVEFKKVMELKANSSNNTLYADADGNIAYFHVNYVPRRDDKYNWRLPVDGSDPGTTYRGILNYSELPHLVNPASGWVYNSNNWPWSAAGPSSLKQADYPKYVDSGTESARGLHAIRVLEGRRDFTLEKLNEAAYDSYLTWFEKPIPALIKAWDAAPDTDPLKAKTTSQIDVLRKWDLRWSVDSVPTSLAIFWAEDLMRRVAANARNAGISPAEFIATKADASTMLQAVVSASERLARDFGKWDTPWGEINRFQRLTGDIVQPFSDDGPSIPVGFTSAAWGSLASFGARPTRNTKKWYGTSGNSFVAVVEFGKTVRAIAVTAGGESGHPASKHFKDQAERYSTGDLREVYFYPAQLKEHTARSYKPGK
ncbi:MAG: penicillin acylase family protein [Acidobacteria bacterium]|nr:penicillin acylase family protein [Acidobacteriota bacterium]